MPRESPWRERLARVAAAALIASIAANVVLYVFADDLGPLRKGREASWLRHVAETTGIRGAVCTNKLGRWQDDNWYRGLFTTYWAAGEKGDQAQFLGQFEGRYPNAIARQLIMPVVKATMTNQPARLPAYTVLIYGDHELAEMLLRLPGFHRSDSSSSDRKGLGVEVLEYYIWGDPEHWPKGTVTQEPLGGD